jgi:Co/Zn/Cd efflux system component
MTSIANAGVITAGVLVRVTGSAVPDLVVGAIIAVVVFTGALRILRVSAELQARV